MTWRKWNRWIHRELGYLFFGMALVYGISGIALNHGVARHWDPGIITRSESYRWHEPLTREQIDRKTVEEILDLTGERAHYKQHYFPNEDKLILYLRGGHVSVILSEGVISVIKIRNRPLFREVNYLHYNKPKKLWTWFSDLFGLALVLLALSGVVMLKGKKGLTGLNGLLILAGIAIPLLFLIIYLW